MALFKTLSPTNQFRFACPVFGAEVAIADCFKLRAIVQRGGRPEERRGCQCAMRSSKCPIPRVLTVLGRKDNDDPYHSVEPKLGRLNPDILDHIKPILVHEPFMDEYAVPASERALLIEGNERAGDTITKRSTKREPIASVDFQPVIGAPASPTRDDRAAMTGDMGAAISKAIAKSPESPATAVAAKKAPVAAKIAPAPPVAIPAKSSGSEIAKSLPPAAIAGKPPSLLELARARRAAS